MTIIFLISVDVNLVEPIFSLNVFALAVAPPILKVKHLPLSSTLPFLKVDIVEIDSPIFLKVFNISLFVNVAFHE